MTTNMTKLIADIATKLVICGLSTPNLNRSLDIDDAISLAGAIVERAEKAADELTDRRNRRGVL